MAYVFRWLFEYNLMQILDVVNLNHIYGWVQIEKDAGFSSLMLD